MEDLHKFLGDFANGLVIDGVAGDSRTNKYKKCKITLMEIKGEVIYQLEYFTDKQAFHKNITLVDIAVEIERLLTEDFRQFEYSTADFSYSLKISKKEKLLSNRRANINRKEISPKSHNREKEYLLKEGNIIPPLIDLGVFTMEGKVVNSMYDKYKQINRFVEIIDDVVKKDNGKSLNIIDFGCGKSYLTFIVYYYLTVVKGIETTITGLDLKADVIADCNRIAKNYGYTGLNFIVGDIADYKADRAIDMVITLHACDTATDYALYHAVNLGSRIILSVPCCQHQINAQIGSDKNTLFTRYGIIKERFSALATDAIRGNLLQLMGYHTQLLEFVDLVHSPKNILIRAVKGTPEGEPQQLIKEIEDLCKEYGVKPELKKLLGDCVYPKSKDLM